MTQNDERDLDGFAVSPTGEPMALTPDEVKQLAKNKEDPMFGRLLKPPRRYFQINRDHPLAEGLVITDVEEPGTPG